jgi:hypothetical protein
MRCLTAIYTLLIAVFSMAQGNTLTVYNPNGKAFFVSLNEVQQHSESYTNVKITGLTTGTYDFRMVFSDGSTTELRKKILLEDPGDYLITVSGKGKSKTLKFIELKNGKTPVPAGSTPVEFRPNDQVPFSDKKSSAVPDNRIEVGVVTPTHFGHIDLFTKTYDPADTLSDEIHEKAYSYYNASDWKALEVLFTDGRINGGWPPNRGFIRYETQTLKAGTEIDRYGGYIDKSDGKFHDKGNFVSPLGASFESRALPASTVNKAYAKYVVKKDIPNVKSGEAIPWFGQPGMGIQYELPENIDDLIGAGYIELMQE